MLFNGLFSLFRNSAVNFKIVQRKGYFSAREKMILSVAPMEKCMATCVPCALPSCECRLLEKDYTL